MDLFPEYGTETCRKEIQGRAREAECWVYGGKTERAALLTAARTALGRQAVRKSM